LIAIFIAFSGLRFPTKKMLFSADLIRTRQQEVPKKDMRMDLHCQFRLLALSAFLLLALCSPAIAQESVDLLSGDRVPAGAEESVDLLSGDQAPAIAQESFDLTICDRITYGIASQKTLPADDNGSHLGPTPYLWFFGVHDTVGTLGRITTVHTSAADVQSQFNVGLMAFGGGRTGRFLLPVNVKWTNLFDDKASGSTTARRVAQHQAESSFGANLPTCYLIH
jgi:hypothetical protein